MVRFELTVVNSQFMAINDEWKSVEVKTDYTLSNWDDVNNLIGYLVEGREGKTVKLELKMVREENDVK